MTRLREGSSDSLNPPGPNFRSFMMSLMTPEQITAAQKANLDVLFGLTNKAFEGFEKLVQLNLDVVKSTFAEIQQNAQQALSVKEPQALLELPAGPMQAFAEKALSYGRPV